MNLFRGRGLRRFSQCGGLSLALLALVPSAQPADGLEPDAYVPIIRAALQKEYHGMLREEGGSLQFPFITPGSAQYADILWDWDSWLSDVALRQILREAPASDDARKLLRYEQGCVLNYLSYGGMDGWIPITIYRNSPPRATLIKGRDMYQTNMHKPCLAQHAAFLVAQDNGNAEWLRERFYFLQTFVDRYRNHQRHKATGLYFWNDDTAIGVDNDPCTFMRPKRSSGSIYLNCLMYKEYLAMVYLCSCLHLDEIGREYQQDADELKTAIQRYCWDERDGFFYSVDLNLPEYVLTNTAEPNASAMPLHAGFPRDYDCLIQRIDVWSGFMAMWAGIATPEQARRMVQHLMDERTFNAAYGVRTLSKLEKMYNVRASGNPSLWTGPIWGISNYLVFRGLVRYGFTQEARDLANKTIVLFGRDLERNGALHEYYLPDSGEPVLNRGFQNWNYLVLNMIVWREGKQPVAEF